MSLSILEGDVFNYLQNINLLDIYILMIYSIIINNYNKYS